MELGKAPISSLHCIYSVWKGSLILSAHPGHLPLGTLNDTSRELLEVIDQTLRDTASHYNLVWTLMNEIDSPHCRGTSHSTLCSDDTAAFETLVRESDRYLGDASLDTLDIYNCSICTILDKYLERRIT